MLRYCELHGHPHVMSIVKPTRPQMCMKCVIWNRACVGNHFQFLHCILIQVILCERTTRAFLADTGKRILSSIIVKARKVSVCPFIPFVHIRTVPSPTNLLCGLQSPKRFEEVFEEMICFLEQTDHWENTEMELSARGVRDLLLYRYKTCPRY